MGFATILGMAIGAFCVAGVHSVTTDDRPATTIKPLVFWTGRDSEVQKPSAHLITSGAEWNKIWDTHLGKRANHAWNSWEIDFEKCMVVAIFQGAKRQSRGLEIHIIDAPDRIRLHYLHMPYSIGHRVGERDDSADDRPYAFVVLPASSKPILLENGNAPKDRNATWLFPGPGIPLRVEEPIPNRPPL